MNSQTEVYARFMRPASLLGGLVAYVAFTWFLLDYGYLQTTLQAYIQLICVWAVGFVLLNWIPSIHSSDWISDDAWVLCRALWCNVGVITVAVMVPYAMRLPLLVIPLFAVFYSALHLNRRQVAWIAVGTWLTYLFASLSAAQLLSLELRMEGLLALVFGLLLGGCLLLSWEALRLRDSLIERNRGLREAMERLQQLALRDELTNVHNRRYLLEVLARQKALADRGQHAFTVCYCDLDHFKQLNDRYGHSVGDAALRQFAELAQQLVRNVDYVGRLGGEEFLMVLVDADAQAASNVAQRLARRLRDSWIVGTERDYILTVSIGITEYQSPEAVDDVLNRADRALYLAKQNGRDRVEIAS